MKGILEGLAEKLDPLYNMSVEPNSRYRIFYIGLGEHDDDDVARKRDKSDPANGRGIAKLFTMILSSRLEGYEKCTMKYRNASRDLLQEENAWIIVTYFHLLSSFNSGWGAVRSTVFSLTLGERLTP